MDNLISELIESQPLTVLIGANNCGKSHLMEQAFLSIPGARIYQAFNIKALGKPQNADLPSDFLLEDGSNLALVLKRIQDQIGEGWFLRDLEDICKKAKRLIVAIKDNKVTFSIEVKGSDPPIPARHLSAGTLRYLLLMALLLDPDPPPLLCIESPEIGLHPDIMMAVDRMLYRRSCRAQVIITTYSTALLSYVPVESVVVCERGQKPTRLNSDNLESYLLNNYSVGDMWRMGVIGGNP